MKNKKKLFSIIINVYMSKKGTHVETRIKGGENLVSNISVLGALDIAKQDLLEIRFRDKGVKKNETKN